MSRFYILDEEHKVVPLGDEPTDQWCRWRASADRHVASTFTEAYWVSTVFLGTDHRFGGDGPPLLFETGVFPKDSMIALEMTRYASWDDALTGHKAALRRVLTKEKEAATT